VLGLLLLATLTTGPSAARRTPLVQAVDRARAAVVNINAEEVVRAPAANDPWQLFFGGRVRDQVRTSLGSGFVFDERGFVLTNYHVVARGTRIQVSFEDGSDFTARVVGTDPGGDLAVLKIQADQKFPAAPLGTSSDLLLGEPTIAIGNPFGLNQSVSMGQLCSDYESLCRYPRNYPSQECQDCRAVRKEEQFDKICPVLYQRSDLSRLPASQLKEAMEWKYGDKGLILLGDTGTGKSRVAWTLLRRVLVADKKEVGFRWFDCIEFGHAIAKHYHEEDAEEWLYNLAKVDLLFFDDLGKLKMTERAETELFGLVERRCANQLPIIATTNDTGDTLAARMTDNRGPALIRRLREFCQIIQFTRTP